MTYGGGGGGGGGGPGPHSFAHQLEFGTTPGVYTMTDVKFRNLYQNCKICLKLCTNMAQKLALRKAI